jgi:CRISPR/Cas system-associated endonuclease Cas3-HD
MNKITFEKAIDIIRREKWKTQRPEKNIQLPMFMHDWTEDKISAHFNKLKELGEVFDFTLDVLINVQKLKKSTYELAEIFNKIDSDTTQGEK